MKKEGEPPNIKSAMQPLTAPFHLPAGSLDAFPGYTPRGLSMTDMQLGLGPDLEQTHELLARVLLRGDPPVDCCAVNDAVHTAVGLVRRGSELDKHLITELMHVLHSREASYLRGEIGWLG